jgi:hypothetical protein
MDKTLKIVLACLGVVAIAIMAIPQGDPLAASGNSAAPANPAGGQPVSAAPSEGVAMPGQPGANAEMPNSTPNRPSSVDSATLQQQTFGQPMLDPRPAAERKAEETIRSPNPSETSFDSGYDSAQNSGVQNYGAPNQQPSGYAEGVNDSSSDAE